MSKSQFYPLQFNPTTGEPYLRLPSPHDNIIITPPRMSDAPDILTNMTDPTVFQWLDGPPHPYLPKHASAWLTEIIAGTDTVIEALQCASEQNPGAPPTIVSGTPVRTIREVREDGSELFLGDIALLREKYPDVIDKQMKEALVQPNADKVLGDPEIVWCIGDYLAASHHGRGIMSAVIRTIIHDWAVPRMGVRHIRVETFDDNIGSRRVFEKNAFVYEKTVLMNRVTNSGRPVKAMDILWWKAE